MKALQLVSLTKTYESGNLNIKVLDDINLSIYPKEFVSIIGSSGSGKTTLLNIISGLEYPDSGRVLINECDLADLNDEERAKVQIKKYRLCFSELQLNSSDQCVGKHNIAC